MENDGENSKKLKEKNGPKAKSVAGYRVFLFHRVLSAYITYTCKANLYMQTRILVAFFFFNGEDLGESKGLVETVLCGKQGTPKRSL